MSMRGGRVHFFDGARRVAGLAAQRTETLLERSRGLLGRDPLAAGDGLLITPCNAVHTFGMGYPIDLVYVARDRRVRKIVSGLRPRRLSWCPGAHAVLELAAGAAARLQLNEGLRMEWCDHA